MTASRKKENVRQALSVEKSVGQFARANAALRRKGKKCGNKTQKMRGNEENNDGNEHPTRSRKMLCSSYAVAIMVVVRQQQSIRRHHCQTNDDDDRTSHEWMLYDIIYIQHNYCLS